MRALFAPAIAVCGRLRNIVKLPLIGLFFTLPLAVALWVSPPAWGQAATWIMLGTYLFAWYFMAGHLLAHDGTWELINKVARKLGEHDLRHDAELSRGTAAAQLGAGQFKRLYDTLADTHDNLKHLVQQARASADAARIAADELASGNVNLSQRTEQQASTLEETASGMEELAATVRQNADNCKLASELSSNAAGVAKKGADRSTASSRRWS